MLLRCGLTWCLLAGTAFAQPQVWAIVVGIDEYVRPSIPKLRYAVADAKLFAQALQDVVKVPRDHIFLMTSDAVDENDQPRFVNVAYRLSSLKGKVKKEDTVIFYFAGHGVTMDGEPFLLTEEADSRSGLTLKASSLHGGDLISTLRKNESGSVWVMLDACRNSPNEKGESKLDPAVSSALSQANVGLSQTATMFSCNVGERAWEWDEKKHGCYSYFLVQGLRSDAADEQGRVTLQRLADYVTREVPNVARRFGSTQTPTMFYGGSTPAQWVLATVSSPTSSNTSKKDADTSRYIAQLEAMQAKLDQETARRVAAEQKAKLAEGMRQAAEQKLALLMKQMSGSPAQARVSAPARPDVLAYSGENSRALQSEIARLIEENQNLKQRLTQLEAQTAKVGMSSRSAILQEQPMLDRAWKAASELETRSQNELAASQDLKRSLELCLQVREALASQATLMQNAYAVSLENRPQSRQTEQEIAVARERAQLAQSLTELYEARQSAALSAIAEAASRLREAEAREKMYLEIIQGLRSELDRKTAQLEKCEAELANTKGELSLKLGELKTLEDQLYRLYIKRSYQFNSSAELERYARHLDDLLLDERTFDEATTLP